MSGIVYSQIDCLITNEGIRKKNGVRPEDADLAIIKNGAIVYSKAKGILWVGNHKSLPKTFRARGWRHVSAKGYVAYPGLVDCHTHPAFAGDRSREFILRMNGASYQEIADAGGGIISSTQHTRAISENKLSEIILERFKLAHGFGVRLLEAKSGYGLDLKNELKSLSAIQKAAKIFPALRVQSTCMAAHAFPTEFKNSPEKYVEIICNEILPAVAKKKLAQYCDVFCDHGYFSIEQTKKIITHAKLLGLGVRLHGEELAHTGAAELAADNHCLSVDHLLKISDQGIRKLAASKTIGTLLPGTSLYLKEPPAPARKMIDGGVAVALATDFNPGSCPTQNLPFIGTLAAIQLGMTSAEIIAGITWNAARALASENSFGALLPGYIGEPIFCEGDHPSALFYKMAQGSLPKLI